MKNKRYIVLGTAVLAMVLLTASFAVSGIKGQMASHFGKGHMKEHILSKMDYTVQELRLTPDQQKKYTVIRDKMSVHLDTMAKRHETMREELRKEWERPDPDIKVLAGKIKKEIESMPNPLVEGIDYMLQVYDILDKEQQKQFTAMLKDHFGHKPFMRGPGGPGGPGRGPGGPEGPGGPGGPGQAPGE